MPEPPHRHPTRGNQMPKAAPGSAQAPSAAQEDDKDRTIAELRRAVQDREDLLAIAAHELRNPITPIQLSLQIIRKARERGDHVIGDELARLERSVDRFLERTNVLLNLMQLSANKLQLQPAEVNLSSLIEEILDERRSLFAYGRSDLRVDLDRELVGFLDRVALSQVVENLLSNAIKYGGGKPIDLRLSADQGVARLAVQDRGVGIAEEDQARIFERFERARRNHNQPGFGLGLWITRRLVEAMGGTIAVSSKEGEGSLFTVALPLNRKSDD
jgi:signal transduction histidine kinase